MKKLTSILFLIIIMLTGCSAPIGIDDITPSSDDANTISDAVNTRACNVNSLTFEQVKNYLDQCGYNTSTLTEYEDYYLIDSDIRNFTGRSLQRYWDLSKKAPISIIHYRPTAPRPRART